MAFAGSAPLIATLAPAEAGPKPIVAEPHTTSPALGKTAVAWRRNLDGAVYASPLVVGGITVVATENDTVYGFDSAYRQVWKTRLGTTAQGFPTTFSVDGQQFVAVPTGYSGGSPEARPTSMFAFERNRPLVGHAVYVFALPEDTVKTANPK